VTHQNTGLRQRNTVRKRACGGRTTSTLRVLAAAKSPIWFFKPPKIKPLSPTASGARQAIGRRLGEKCQQASGSPSRRQATRAVTDRARVGVSDGVKKSRRRKSPDYRTCYSGHVRINSLLLPRELIRYRRAVGGRDATNCGLAHKARHARGRQAPCREQDRCGPDWC